MASSITSVWMENFEKEMIRMNGALYRYSIVSFDTEFPGFLQNTCRTATEEVRYVDMEYNVNHLELIQLGVTLCDSNGEIGGVWEFNFNNFDPNRNLQAPSSVEFLRKSGLDLERAMKEGVAPIVFKDRFLELLSSHKGLQWVTFHGMYDIAYVMELVTNRALPHSISGFVELCGKIFGRVYDVKFMARFCPGLLGGELGLEKLAKILKVERLGGAHQAGSDSLLTALVFTKMKRDYQLAEAMFEGNLYGISTKIVNLQRPPVMVLLPPLPQRVYPRPRPVLLCPTYYSMPAVNIRPVARYPVNVNQYYVHMR